MATFHEDAAVLPDDIEELRSHAITAGVVIVCLMMMTAILLASLIF